MSFNFFEIFLLLELVCTYDKLNKYKMKKNCHRHLKGLS